MYLLNTKRYVYFYIFNSGAPVTGLTQASFTIIFTRNDLTSPDTLTILELGAGRYEASYIPTTTGEDYIDIYNATYNTRIVNVENIVSVEELTNGSSIVSLTANYPTANALKVTEVSSPEEYTLYVYLYSDWSVGHQSVSYSQGQTQLNSNGTWVRPILILPDFYTVVVSNGTSVVVINSRLSVA